MRRIASLLRITPLLAILGSQMLGWEMNLIENESYRIELTSEEAHRWKIVEGYGEGGGEEGLPEASVIDALSVALEGVFVPQYPFIITHNLPGWVFKELGIDPTALGFTPSEFSLLQSSKLSQKDSVGLKGALGILNINNEYKNKKLYVFLEVVIPRKPAWDKKRNKYYVDVSVEAKLVRRGKWNDDLPEFKWIVTSGEEIAKLVVRKINKIAGNKEKRIKAKIIRRAVPYFSHFLKELMKTILRRNKYEFRLCPHTVSFGNVLLYVRNPLPPYSNGKWTVGRRARQMVFFSYYIRVGDKGIRLEGSLLRIMEPLGGDVLESELPLLHSPGHSVSETVKGWEKVKEEVKALGLRIEKIAVASSWTEWNGDRIGATSFFQTSTPNATTRNTLYRMLKEGILHTVGEEEGREVLASFPGPHTPVVAEAIRKVAAWYAENVVENVMKEKLVEDWRFEEFPEPWNQIV